jgi:hypothetical protein
LQLMQCDFSTTSTYTRVMAPMNRSFTSSIPLTYWDLHTFFQGIGHWTLQAKTAHELFSLGLTAGIGARFKILHLAPAAPSRNGARLYTSLFVDRPVS